MCVCVCVCLWASLAHGNALYHWLPTSGAVAEYRAGIGADLANLADARKRVGEAQRDKDAKIAERAARAAEARQRDRVLNPAKYAAREQRRQAAMAAGGGGGSRAAMQASS